MTLYLIISLTNFFTLSTFLKSLEEKTKEKELRKIDTVSKLVSMAKEKRKKLVEAILKVMSDTISQRLVDYIRKNPSSVTSDSWISELTYFFKILKKNNKMPTVQGDTLYSILKTNLGKDNKLVIPNSFYESLEKDKLRARLRRVEETAEIKEILKSKKEKYQEILLQDETANANQMNLGLVLLQDLIKIDLLDEKTDCYFVLPGDEKENYEYPLLFYQINGHHMEKIIHKEFFSNTSYSKFYLINKIVKDNGLMKEAGYLIPIELSMIFNSINKPFREVFIAKIERVSKKNQNERDDWDGPEDPKDSSLDENDGFKYTVHFFNLVVEFLANFGYQFKWHFEFKSKQELNECNENEKCFLIDETEFKIPNNDSLKNIIRYNNKFHLLRQSIENYVLDPVNLFVYLNYLRNMEKFNKSKEQIALKKNDFIKNVYLNYLRNLEKFNKSKEQIALKKNDFIKNVDIKMQLIECKHKQQENLYLDEVLNMNLNEIELFISIINKRKQGQDYLEDKNKLQQVLTSKTQGKQKIEENKIQSIWQQVDEMKTDEMDALIKMARGLHNIKNIDTVSKLLKIQPEERKELIEAVLVVFYDQLNSNKNIHNQPGNKQISTKIKCIFIDRQKIYENKNNKEYDKFQKFLNNLYRRFENRKKTDENEFEYENEYKYEYDEYQTFLSYLNRSFEEKQIPYEYKSGYEKDEFCKFLQDLRNKFLERQITGRNKNDEYHEYQNIFYSLNGLDLEKKIYQLFFEGEYEKYKLIEAIVQYEGFMSKCGYLIPAELGVIFEAINNY